MRTRAKGAARAALLTAGFVALGANTVFPNAAYADDTSGASSVLGGNQINLPISIPINISGNAASVAGKSNAGSEGGARVFNQGGAGGGQTTSGRSSVLGGNQINAPISAPVNACGNAVAIFGTADAGCKGGARVVNGGGAGGGQSTSGKSSVLGGNQVNAPISAPIDACGNALAIFGNAYAGCEGGASVKNTGGHGGSGQTTNGDYSIGGGNQANAPVSAPIDVCGNSAGLFGDAVAGCKGGAYVKNTDGHGSGQRTSGRSSVLGGNQANAPVSAPIDVCGNGSASCEGGASVMNSGGSGSNTTNGDSGVLAGNQVHAPVGAPIDVCGNAVALHGKAGADCQGGAFVHNHGSRGADSTSGKSGVATGNQVIAPITAPTNVCGNAAAVLGDASAGCVGTAVAKGDDHGGQHTTGGNRVDGPAQAPVDTCGNVATLGGQVDPICGNGAMVDGDNGHYGGVITTDHQAAPVAGPAAPGLPGLPVLPGLTSVLPMTPGSALPALPQLPTRVPQSAPADGLPVQAPGLPQLPGQGPAGVEHLLAYGQPVPGGHKPGKPRKSRHTTPRGNDTTGTTGAKPNPEPPTAPQPEPKKRGTSHKHRGAHKPRTSHRGTHEHKGSHKRRTHRRPRTQLQAAPYGMFPMTGLAGALPAGLPQVPAGLPQLPAGLPQVPAGLPQVPAGLPQLPAGLPQLPTGLPELPAGLPQLPGQSPATLPTGLPSSLPRLPLQAPAGLPQLPGGVERQSDPAPRLPDLPDLPVLGVAPLSGHLNSPQVGGVTDKLANLNNLRPAASTTPETKGGSALYVLMVGGLLAAASSILAFGRKIRFGRR